MTKSITCSSLDDIINVNAPVLLWLEKTKHMDTKLLLYTMLRAVFRCSKDVAKEQNTGGHLA